jgi:uncharacterized protein (DUF1778 family)
VATLHSASSVRVEFRIPANLKAEVEEAAALAGVTFASFATEALVERVRQIKRDLTLTVLDNEERDAFPQMLAEPPKPSPALIKLMKTQARF